MWKAFFLVCCIFLISAENSKEIRDVEYKLKTIMSSKDAFHLNFVIDAFHKTISIISSTYQTTQLPSNPIILPGPGAGRPNHEYPTTIFDIGGWIGYGVFLAIIFILPFIVCIILCCFMCCLYWGRCCGLCGGRKIKQSSEARGYKTPERLVLLIPYVIIYGLILAAAVVAIVFTVTFVESGRAITTATANGVDDILGIVGDVKDSADSVFDQANGVALSSSGRVSGINGLNGVVGKVIETLGTIEPVFDAMDVELKQIMSNLTEIREVNAGIAENQGLTGVPSNSEIPDFGATDAALNAAKSSLSGLNGINENLATQTENAINQANNAVGQIATQMVKVIDGARGTVNGLLDTAENQINSTFPKKVREDVVYYVNLAETLWSVIFAVIYALPPLILIWGILYILVGKFPLNWCMKFGACYLFLFFGLYLLMFGFQLLATIVLGHACRRQGQVIGQLDARASEFGVQVPIPTPLGNLSISASVNGVLNCKDKETIFDATGISLESLNITSTFNRLIGQVNQTIQAFDIGSTIDKATSSVTTLNSDFYNITTDYSGTITTYRAKLLDVQAQLSDLSRFGFNQSNLDEAFEELNNASAEIGGASFAENNITSFDPENQTPWMTAPNLNYFVNQKDLLVNIVSAKQNATATANAVNANITIIYNDLGNIQYNLNRTLALKNNITSIPARIKNDLSGVGVIVDGVKANCSRLLDDVTSLFLFSLDTFYNLTGCHKVGDFYRDQIQTNLCTNCFTFSVIACIGTVCIGLLMCALYPVCLSGSKRVGNPYQDLAGDEWRNDPPIDKVDVVQVQYGPTPQTDQMIPIPSHEPPKEIDFEHIQPMSPYNTSNIPPPEYIDRSLEFSINQQHEHPHIESLNHEPMMPNPFGEQENDLDAQPVVVNVYPTSPPMGSPPNESLNVEPSVHDEDLHYRPPSPPIEEPPRNDYRIGELDE